uniref:Uncharacterized protein n=1 Tax=Romanomermis culicivorax TaxID=13658 RepID=A0A915JA33_ROMCU
MAEISSGKNRLTSPLCSTSIFGLPPSDITLNGQCFILKARTRIAYQSFGIGKGDIARSRTVSLIVGDDFNFTVHKNAHAAVRRTQ